MRFTVAERATKRPPRGYQAPVNVEAALRRQAAGRKVELANLGRLEWHACEWRACDLTDCPNHRPEEASP